MEEMRMSTLEQRVAVVESKVEALEDGHRALQANVDELEDCLVVKLRHFQDKLLDRLFKIIYGCLALIAFIVGVLLGVEKIPNFFK